MPDNFYEQLVDEQSDQLDLALNHTNAELFLAVLYECIIMRITVKMDPGAEDFVDYTTIK